jgi:hypothetical protein
MRLDRTSTAARALDAAVAAYRDSGEVAPLLNAIDRLRSTATVDEIIEATEPHLQIPEVAGPAYEIVIEQRPDDARALVVLAGSYWLTGRGPDVVGELASRALASDPGNRGAWHLWAITESDPRLRMERWLQVSRRFPEDNLAHANLADSATSIASAENDPVALSLALDTYQKLLVTAQHPEQRAAIEKALETLRNWRV